MNGEIFMKNNKKELGYSSRKKKQLIEEAMSLCTGKDMYNKFKICEQVAEIMINKYNGKNLEYHSKRMGLDTNKKILNEIDQYFYKTMECDVNCEI